MKRLIFTLMAAMVLLMAGCATSGGTSAGASGASDNGGLPEIAAMDDEPIPALDAPATE